MVGVTVKIHQSDDDRAWESKWHKKERKNRMRSMRTDLTMDAGRFAEYDTDGKARYLLFSVK